MLLMVVLLLWLLLMLLMLLVNPGAFSIFAVLDHHLVRNMLIDFAALELLADALVFLDAEAPLLMEVFLHWLLDNFLFLHEDTEYESQEG